MIVLDTNVLSELMRAHPDEAVVAWLLAVPSADLFTTTVTQAEILSGLALMPDGKRQLALRAAAERLFAVDLAGRILPFDSDAAHAFARVVVERRKAGRPIGNLDAQIAAVARAKGADVASRNVEDFRGCGIVVRNPWND
ncbi:type II toxin-antitoxin system VapC family toxin [Labrys wisconsinensis]|uniref:Ribonuclease VapC n=1 Tax=Labrys wisconsinensis TaxID=425677 RepID=A0ABU0JKV7_9HYPH|nr:type II toxin-antitoxin system VapC family toxin [Labrys wisconsinensis]MDQ0474919.1 putative nucleic acid-binding protein [Labrys wisconsinensis]